jgi:hypothetical protein
MGDNVIFQSDRLATVPVDFKCATERIDGADYQKVVETARWGSGDGEIDQVRIDASTNSLQTVGYEHHEIHSGSHYFVCGYQDLANGNVLDFTWQMPNTAKWIHWNWKISTESEFLWQIYEGVTATNPLANSIIPKNSNRNSENVSGTIMKFELQATLAAANTDTSVGGAELLESGLSGAGKDAGNAVRQNELVLKEGALYCMRAEANAAGFVNFDMQWYEHTDKH